MIRSLLSSKNPSEFMPLIVPKLKPKQLMKQQQLERLTRSVDHALLFWLPRLSTNGQRRKALSGLRRPRQSLCSLGESFQQRRGDMEVGRSQRKAKKWRVFLFFYNSGVFFDGSLFLGESWEGLFVMRNVAATSPIKTQSAVLVTAGLHDNPSDNPSTRSSQRKTGVVHPKASKSVSREKKVQVWKMPWRNSSFTAKRKASSAERSLDRTTRISLPSKCCQWWSSLVVW